jgi:hypothetical protein
MRELRQHCECVSGVASSTLLDALGSLLSILWREAVDKENGIFVSGADGKDLQVTELIALTRHV